MLPLQQDPSDHPDQIILGLASRGFGGVLRNDSPATIAWEQCLEGEPRQRKEQRFEVRGARGQGSFIVLDWTYQVAARYLIGTRVPDSHWVLTYLPTYLST